MAHATVIQLRDHLEPDPLPANAQQLLDRASRDVDRALLAAVYDPASTTVLATLRDATLEQVSHRLSRGEEDGLPGGYQQVSIGSLTLNRGGTGPSDGTPTLGAQAFTILQLAGLTGFGPQSV